MNEVEEHTYPEFMTGNFYFNRKRSVHPEKIMIAELERQKRLQEIVKNIPIRECDQFYNEDEEKKSFN